jgi:SAM-dependent methyltransferase
MPAARSEDRVGPNAAKAAALRVRDRLYSVSCRLADPLGLLLGQRDHLTPPSHLFADPDRVDGSRDLRDFVLVGESTVRWLISQGLQPSHRVLEVGCGIGRMAIPLTRYLLPGASYDGIDITAAKIDYCRSSVGRVAKNFRFVHADVYSKYYNPRGKMAAAAYTFPYGDGTIDFAFLTSVFTHMLPDDVAHYLSEISRVLVPGGRCISSFWITDKPKNHRFSDVCYIYNLAEPEWGVYYLEEFVRSSYDRNGFAIERIWYGSESGREDANPDSRQDLVIAVKAPRS